MKRFGVLASGLLYSLFWFCFSFFSNCNKHQTSSFWNLNSKAVAARTQKDLKL
jgi:hypothetical protein